MQKGRQTYWNLCAALFLVFIVGIVQSFAQLDTGSIVGTVRDNSGAVVSAAAVKITNTKTGKVFETQDVRYRRVQRHRIAVWSLQSRS